MFEEGRGRSKSPLSEVLIGARSLMSPSPSIE